MTHKKQNPSVERRESRPSAVSAHPQKARVGHPQVRTAARSERYIFVGDFWAGAAWGFFSGAGMIEILPAGCTTSSGGACACGHTIAAAAQHAHFIGNDLCGVSFHAFFILPFSGFYAALDKDERPFLQVLLHNFSQFPPRFDAMPFGTLLSFPVTILVRGVRSHIERRHGLAT